MMKDQKSKSHGVVFFGDIWGFKAMVEKDSDFALAKSEELISQICNENFQDDNEIPFAYYFLSDCIFYSLSLYPDSKSDNENNLDVFFRVVKNSSRIASELGVCLRGAVEFGTLTTKENQLVGTAVNNAVELEKVISFPLCLIEHATLKRLTQSGFVKNQYARHFPTSSFAVNNQLFNVHIFNDGEQHINTLIALYEEEKKKRLDEKKRIQALTLHNTLQMLLELKN